MEALETKARQDAIPEELEVLRQWVPWRIEDRDGKPTKVPYSPKLRGKRGSLVKASASDPATWGTYEKALKTARKHGMDGVGLVFSKGDPYCGVDLDGCRDPETGELEEWAREIVAALDSYSEASPSGTGVHVIVRGCIPASGNRKGAVEMYDRGRFFTMTGEILDGAPAEIWDRQGELEALHRQLFPPAMAARTVRNGHPATSPTKLPDDVLLKRAKAAKNGERFAKLWAGDGTGYASDSEADLALCSLLAFWTQDEDQINRLFQQSGLYREKWKRADYHERTIRKAIEDRAEVWDGGAAVVPMRPRVGERNSHGSAGGGGAPPVEADYNLTDLGNAERFADAHSDAVLWVEQWKFWVVWDGKRWTRDWTREVWRRAQLTVRDIYAEASRAEDSERRKAIANHAKRSETATRIREMLELVKSQAWATPEEFDRSPWLLNVENGTLDLRTGERHAHRREDRITKFAPVSYNPDATAPTFAVFLARIQPSEEMRRFLQRAVGYSATGDVSEQCLFINWGAGANGKSTFQEAISAALGDYAMQAPTELLLAKPAGTDGIPNDVARLKGARFVSASEVEEGRRFAEARVKQLTGGDTISARFLHAEFFDFEPTHKLWLSTNPKPDVSRGGHAFWRRIKLIPWPETIPLEEQDPKLSGKLKEELPGILTWIVGGAVAWQEGGLQTPEVVKAATEEYREETDTLAAFVRDCCVKGPNLRAQGKPLYEAYKRWCVKNGEQHETNKRFSQQLIERGFEKHKEKCVWYLGLALRPKDDEPRDGLFRPPAEPPDDGAPPLRDEDAPLPPAGPPSEHEHETPARGEDATTQLSSAVGPSEEPGRPLPSNSPSEALRGDPSRSGKPPGAYSPTPDELTEEPPAEVDRPESMNGAQKARNDAEDLGVRVREELQKPWAIQQLGLIRSGRENLINPLANAVACELFGAPHRWREVLPFVEEHLKRGEGGG